MLQTSLNMFFLTRAEEVLLLWIGRNFSSCNWRSALQDSCCWWRPTWEAVSIHFHLQLINIKLCAVNRFSFFRAVFVFPGFSQRDSFQTVISSIWVYFQSLNRSRITICSKMGRWFTSVLKEMQTVGEEKTMIKWIIKCNWGGIFGVQKYLTDPKL